MAIIAAMLAVSGQQIALAASSWSPTLLVNTEAFQTIDVGDGATNIELRFGSNLNAKIIYDLSNGRFNFTKPIYVQGGITATGSITTRQTLSGQTLHVSGDAAVRGPLAVSGALRTDGNLSINDDGTAADAVLTFGNATLNQSLKYLHAQQKFEFSKDVRVTGNISGSSLTVDGNLNLHGLSYNFPSSRGAADSYLKEDGNGNLTWAAVSTGGGNGSGNILTFHPQYPNATYFSSGATTVGQMTYGYDATNKENYYRWSSTQAALHDYWISIRVRVPDNFASWDPIQPIAFRYRTGNGSASNNYLTMKLLDTAGNPVALSNASGLANTSWTTATVTGPQSAGTFTPKGYFTVLIKQAANSSGSADAGYFTLNWETTNP